MTHESARDEILKRLKSARRGKPPARRELPPLNELSLDREGMIKKFSDQLWLQTGVVHRVADTRAALEKLSEVAREEKLEKVMVATDSVIAPLDLPAWGAAQGITIFRVRDFMNRDAFKHAVFNEVQAGITGADFAVAETGTLGLIHDKDQARLISLAPILHIVIVPADRFVAVYEQAIEEVFADTARLPSQFCFITGPSMTADIQATPFKGMHGPRRLIVIIIG